MQMCGLCQAIPISRLELLSIKTVAKQQNTMEKGKRRQPFPRIWGEKNTHTLTCDHNELITKVQTFPFSFIVSWWKDSSTCSWRWTATMMPTRVVSAIFWFISMTLLLEGWDTGFVSGYNQLINLKLIPFSITFGGQYFNDFWQWTTSTLMNAAESDRQMWDDMSHCVFWVNFN